MPTDRSYFNILMKDGSSASVVKLSDVELHGVPGFALHRERGLYKISHVDTGALAFKMELGLDPSPDVLTKFFREAHKYTVSRENVLAVLGKHRGPRKLSNLVLPFYDPFYGTC